MVADSGIYVLQSSNPALRANTSLTVLEPITNVTVNASQTELVEFTGVDGNHTLTIQNVTRYDAGPISCHVANALGNATSHPITFIVSYGPEDMSLALGGSLLVGSNLTLVCQFLNETGQDALTLSGVEERHSGLYSCRAFNNKTRRWTSATKHILIRAPPSSEAQQWKILTTSWIFIMALALPSIIFLNSQGHC
ncbi:hypothetical protein ACEWY4_019741 [Coilia grayii]|uniref:Immunoglobulin domain-containing protein n=1 Tax=Coilia grayii TaxID=363190 RepID=A0ABD1JAK7_9TELE